MTKKKLDASGPTTIVDRDRRKIIRAAGSGVVASMFGGVAVADSHSSRAKSKTIRWGFVGTGSIAQSMANTVQRTPAAELVAISSRRMESAVAFADKNGASKAFDSWAEMAAWDGIDAIYVATPTSVREEICIAAANNGKHVLGEKPFASLPSLQRIVSACRENNVGFMDGTHFGHHPRTAAIKASMGERVGWPWSVDSAFQFMLRDKGNIRFNPRLEPMGAIGDAGWYNMRAAVEYISPGATLASASAYLRRDKETNAAIGGSGVLVFDDGSTSTWNCGFDSGAVAMDLRISGDQGSIVVEDFLSQDRDGSASYVHRGGGWGANAQRETVRVDSPLPGSALMFENFAALVHDPSLRQASITISERTQALLDAVWNDAIANEAG